MDFLMGINLILAVYKNILVVSYGGKNTEFYISKI